MDLGYNADRNIATGNLYKHLVADLMKGGVHVECTDEFSSRRRWQAALLQTLSDLKPNAVRDIS